MTTPHHEPQNVTINIKANGQRLLWEVTTLLNKQAQRETYTTRHHPLSIRFFTASPNWKSLHTDTTLTEISHALSILWHTMAALIHPSSKMKIHWQNLDTQIADIWICNWKWTGKYGPLHSKREIELISKHHSQRKMIISLQGNIYAWGFDQHHPRKLTIASCLKTKSLISKLKADTQYLSIVVHWEGNSQT